MLPLPGLPTEYGEPRACTHQAGRGRQLAVPAVNVHLPACPVLLAALLVRTCTHDACLSRRVSLPAGMNWHADVAQWPPLHDAPSAVCLRMLIASSLTNFLLPIDIQDG